MKSKILLFTSPTCPNCPPAKNFLQEFSKERKDFVVEEHSTMYKESQVLAQKFEVMAVPTFIIQGPKYEKNIGFVGLPSKAKFNELLDLSLGIEKQKEKPKKKSSGLKIGKFKIKF